jgi:hypothetical protein
MMMKRKKGKKLIAVPADVALPLFLLLFQLATTAIGIM